eukprot:GFUD01007606.1.p1 GENE.GFUD01007606.1~~GFUD01007606.1.p1  ORF type:complete len:568 (-),score=141.64 GFUD01007606.1:432-2135(-)
MVDSMGGPGGTMGSQQYCLKWNNHQNNMLRVFTRLLGQEQFTDVILAAEGKRVKCHKMVLSACSSYFEQLFINFSEPNQIVILKDTSFADIAAIVDFMYKGEINVSQDKLSSLLKTAENLKVKGLAEVSGEEKKNNASAAAPSARVPTGSTPGAAPAMPRLTGPPPMQMMGRPTTASSGLTSPDNSFISVNVNGELKRKRGRPRTLDGPDDDNTCFVPRISSVQGAAEINGSTSIPGTHSPSILSQSLSNSGTPSLTFQSSGFEPRAKPIIPGKLVTSTPSTQSMSSLQAALNKPLDQNSKENSNSSPPTSTPSTPAPADPPSTTPTPGSIPIKLEQFDTNSRNCDTPGSMNGSFISSLTPDQVASWGIIKMNDYLVSGTRQQYWEEYFVKHVMSAVKNKEIDMKGAAELLGVSYGTLYGRYRETFGYLKHAWNVSGRPQKKTNLWTDPNTKQILESMRSGSINIKQAAEALGMEPAMLAYQLAGKVSGDSDNNSNKYPRSDENGMDDDFGDDDDNDYNEQLMEVQPDIIMNDDDDDQIEHFDSIVEEGVDPILEIEYNKGVDPTMS